MNDERYDTLGKTTTQEFEKDAKHDANRDPVTGEPGSHPVGTGVGAAGGATAGAAIGIAVGGPVGAMIGAAVGGIAGGLAGKGVAEAVNPTEEDAYWRDNYGSRPYAGDRTYDDLRPAYQYGWEARGRHSDRTWNDAESDLESGWNTSRGTSGLGWNEARHATRDAWDRVGERLGTAGTSAMAGVDTTTTGSYAETAAASEFGVNPNASGLPSTSGDPTSHHEGVEPKTTVPGGSDRDRR